MPRLPAAALIALACAVAAGPLGAQVSAASFADLRRDWERGRDRLPLRMTVLTEEVGKQGETLSREEREYALSYPRGPKDPDSRLLRAVKNGRDITESERKKTSRRRESDDFPDGNPLAPEVQSLLVLQEPLKDGAATLIPYRIGHPKRAVTGQLRLDERGEPLAYAYSYDPLPALVQSYDAEVALRRLEDGSLVVRRIDFGVEGSLLLIRKKFRISLEFSDFQGE